MSIGDARASGGPDAGLLAITRAVEDAREACDGDPAHVARRLGFSLAASAPGLAEMSTPTVVVYQWRADRSERRAAIATSLAFALLLRAGRRTDGAEARALVEMLRAPTV